MQFFTVIAALAATALANPIAGGSDTTTCTDETSTPTTVASAGSPICPNGLYANPQCCETSVLGVADVACTSPSYSVDSKEALQADCANSGKTAQCCVLAEIAGLDVLCMDP